VKSIKMEYLLGALTALVVADGLISQFLVRHGLAREGNPLLESLVPQGSFLWIKVAGVLLCVALLWDIYRQWPKLAWVSSLCFVILYTGIVGWNLVMFLVAHP